MSVRPLISPRIAERRRRRVARPPRRGAPARRPARARGRHRQPLHDDRAGPRRAVLHPAVRAALVGSARQRPDRVRRGRPRPRGRRNARAVGAVHPCADPPHHRCARRPAHASDVGDRAQHAGRQPAAAGEPDVGVLPRPDRLRRRLHRPRRDARGRRAPGRVDGNEADRLHEEPRRPRHRRHGRAGVPAPVPDRARLPQPDPRA